MAWVAKTVKFSAMRNSKYIILAFYASFLLYSCQPAEGNRTGSEYMPDMAHAITYEANTYAPYNLHTWDSASVISYREAATPRLPVAGSVPRGYAGLYLAPNADRLSQEQAALDGTIGINAIKVPMNGHAPFYYGNSEEERTRANAEIIANPYPITEAGLQRGKELYTIYCAICHGDKADGVGYLVADENTNAKYPAQPANMLLDTFLQSNNGRYYYAIMYGKNLMGAYKDKLNYEERWQVIHYIHSLQAKDKKLQYDERANTLKPSFGTPAGQLSKLAAGQSGSPAPPSNGEETSSSGGERQSDTQHSGGESGGGR